MPFKRYGKARFIAWAGLLLPYWDDPAFLDENGRPLAKGTHITVTLQYTPPPNTTINLVVNGNVDVTLGDVIFPGAGATQFSFVVVDQTIGGVTSQINATVVIKVSGPNGEAAEVQVPGTIG